MSASRSSASSNTQIQVRRDSNDMSRPPTINLCQLRMVKAMLHFLPLFLLLAANAPADDLTQETTQIESRLSALTGLAFKHPVPHEVITRDQLRKYLESVVKKTLKPEDVRIQEAVLKMLGLVPNDFDLRTTMVDLLTEQAAAFYDYHKKKLFLLDNNSGNERKQALVHELAHALADQNFHLDKYVRESGR